MNITNGDKCSGTRELLQSQAHIWNHMFNFINSMSLKCAVQLNIPDIIHAHARPMTLSNLLQALEIDPTKATHMHRLMQILIHSGFFTLSESQESEEENQEDGYLLTPACRLLLKDEPASVRPWLLFVLDPTMIEPWHSLSPFFRNNDKNAFIMTKGTSVYEYFGNSDKRLGGLFNDAMARDNPVIGGLVVKECGWVFEGLKSVVDVGGGTGMFTRTLSRALPEIDWTVFELPQVVSELEGCNNLRFVGGDMMLDSIPSADAVLLKFVLHNWNDEECVKILKQCKEALPSKGNGGKVIIIDMVVDTNTSSKESLETQLFFDMVMMIFTTGRERDEKNFNQLFLDAGFHGGYKITPLGLRSLIEVFP